MKRTLFLLLTAALALSLAVPALAAPADGVYTVDGEPVPTYAPGGSVFVPVLPVPEGMIIATITFIGTGAASAQSEMADTKSGTGGASAKP